MQESSKYLLQFTYYGSLSQLVTAIRDKDAQVNTDWEQPHDGPGLKTYLSFEKSGGKQGPRGQGRLKLSTRKIDIWSRDTGVVGQ